VDGDPAPGRWGDAARRDTVWMGRTYDAIDGRLAEFVLAQPVFFVATAPLSDEGLVNCSPKGNRGDLVVLGERTVAYRDLTGSGVETISTKPARRNESAA